MKETAEGGREALGASRAKRDQGGSGPDRGEAEGKPRTNIPPPPPPQHLSGGEGESGLPTSEVSPQVFTAPLSLRKPPAAALTYKARTALWPHVSQLPAFDDMGSTSLLILCLAFCGAPQTHTEEDSAPAPYPLPTYHTSGMVFLCSFKFQGPLSHGQILGLFTAIYLVFETWSYYLTLTGLELSM